MADITTVPHETQPADMIQLTINGQAVTARKGQTVLDVCRANHIYVPTLCHYDGLKPVGGCRLCIVEIEGQRRLNTSCTTPAANGMVVQTDTPKLRDLRKRTLELLFAERNHICPYCQESGRCELQEQGYRHGMTHVRYDYLLPRHKIDNSHPYIALDHNRCVLCGRCIRACDEWIGNHTLDYGNRGQATLITPDSGGPLGASSCVSCGMCVEVCPTGALFDKLTNRVLGRGQENPSIRSICTSCSVGCWTESTVRGHAVLQIRSGHGPGSNRVLCGQGRYEALRKANRPAIRRPQLKRAGEWVDVEWKQYFQELAKRIKTGRAGTDPSRVAALVSPSLPLESLALIRQFFREVIGSDRVGWTAGPELQAVRDAFGMDGKSAPLARLSDLDDADLFVTIGCDLEVAAPVVAAYVKRGQLHRHARYVEINPRQTPLSRKAEFRLQPKPGRDALVLGAVLRTMAEQNLLAAPPAADVVAALPNPKDSSFESVAGVSAADVRRLAGLLAGGRRPVFIIGTGLTVQGAEAIQAVINLAVAGDHFTADGRYRILEVPRRANSAGARMFGPTFGMADFDAQATDVLLLFLGDDEPMWPANWADRIRPLVHVTVLAARQQPVCEAAHSIAPVATWAQREGTFVNLEGRVQHATRLVDPPAGVLSAETILTNLAEALGKRFTPNVEAHMPAGLKVAEGQLVPASEPVREVVTCKSKAEGAHSRG